MKYAALLAAALAGCATPQSAPSADHETLSHYLRTNGDGSMAETIVHFFPSDREVSVYKWSAKCTQAAYVTATMGGSPLEPVQLVAGKVGRDGGQDAFGVLNLDDEARRLEIEVSLGGQALSESIDAGPAPWMLYDYDLADLHAMLRHRPEGGDFTVSMRMIWTEGPPFFRSLGRVAFRDEGVEQGVRRYRATGSDGLDGTLEVDARSGQLRRASFNQPNHAGYEDYLLTLIRSQIGGQDAWERLLEDHYGQCEG